MNLRNKLGVTFIAQILGVGATVLANIVIAQRYGPEGQGYLSYYRSTINFLATVGMFGFPQAFVYMINSKVVEASWTVKFSTYYSLLFGMVGIGIGFLLYISGIRDLNGFDLLAVFCIIVASTGMLLQGMYRAISLSIKPIQIFNLISIMPAIFALILYFFWYTDNYHTLVFVMVIAALISSLLAAFMLKEHLLSDQILEDSRLKIKGAVEYGFWSFVPGFAFTFVTTGTYGLLRQGGTTEATAGYFSVSFLLVSTGILPLNMIIPVLFDTWSKESNKNNTFQSYLKLSHLGSLIAIIGVTLGFIIVEPATILVFGADFLPSVLSTKILILSIYALYQSRLLTAMLLAIGSPGSVAIGAVIRTVIIIPSIFFGFANSLAGAALAWTIGEFVSMAYMLVLVCKNTGWPSLQVAGLSLSWLVNNFKLLSTRAL